MRNSTILPPPAGKTCRHPTCGDTCRRPQKEKKRTPIRKQSLKRQEEVKNGNVNKNIAAIKKNVIRTPNAALERWFEDRRKDLVGVCANCGRKSSKNDDKWYKASVAHILPKRLFKSVATHPANYLELCFWGEGSCHTNLDNNMLDLIDLNCFDTVIQRFVEMYPSIDQKERRYIPDVLLQYIEVEL